MDKIIGYTQGAFDMFHIGHLNLLKKAAELCDELIVGVNTDKLIESYKNKKPIIPFEERFAIIEAIKGVSQAVEAETLDKEVMYKLIGFNKIYIGSDWKGNSRWNETERCMSKYGVEVVYLRYTEGISSTIIRNRLSDNEEKKQ